MFAIVRNRKDNQLSKLHLGSGSVYIPGFINVDVDRNLHADVYDDISNLKQFKDNQYELVYACHVLEHFSHDEVPHVLRNWARVLKPGGEIYIFVPDIDRIVQIYPENWEHFQTSGNTPVDRVDLRGTIGSI